MNVVRNVKRNILKGVLIANKLNRRKKQNEFFVLQGFGFIR